SIWQVSLGEAQAAFVFPVLPGSSPVTSHESRRGLASRRRVEPDASFLFAYANTNPVDEWTAENLHARKVRKRSGCVVEGGLVEAILMRVAVEEKDFPWEPSNLSRQRGEQLAKSSPRHSPA